MFSPFPFSDHNEIQVGYGLRKEFSFQKQQIETTFSGYGFDQEPFSECWSWNDISLDQTHPENQPRQEMKMPNDVHYEDLKLGEAKKTVSHSLSMASLELLSNFGNSFKKMKGEKCIEESSKNQRGNQRLSPVEVARVAGARFIHYSSQRNVGLFLHMHPFDHTLTSLSEEETRDVELLYILFAAVEKINDKEFGQAAKWLDRCDWISSKLGDPVQRVAFHFAEALREKLALETGKMCAKGLEEKGKSEMIDAALDFELVTLVWHKEIPLPQAMTFSSVQALLEGVSSARRIHLIDLAIRGGIQWTIFMQALTERREYPIDLLKISAVGIRGGQKIDEVGMNLENFAKSLNIPFVFEKIFVSDLDKLKEEHFHIEDNEAVAVFCSNILRTMVSRPKCLESLMLVLRRLNPSIMLVNEVEANHNSLSFVDRFIEALFFYGAYFDCLDACMSPDNRYRQAIELVYLREGIHNTVAVEGDERLNRNVKIEVWRAFFARFGMEEIELGESALYQGSLVVRQFACGNFCTFDKIGKFLTIGWKGTPVFSVSAWKFQ